MIVATTDNLPNREITEVLGIVFGSCVQTQHVGKDVRAGLRSVIGGEARSHILNLWKKHAGLQCSV